MCKQGRKLLSETEPASSSFWTSQPPGSRENKPLWFKPPVSLIWLGRPEWTETDRAN